MHRFFVDPADVCSNQVTVRGDELKHLRQVLRLAVGDAVMCIDGMGNEIHTRLTHVDKQIAVGQILSITQPATEPRVHVTLFQGIAKNEKMDWIVQKAVELGISRIVPVMSDNGVVRMEANSGKLERWQRIAREAVKQCRRTKIPEIVEPTQLTDAVVRYKDWDMAVLLYEEEQKKGLKDCIMCYNMNDMHKIALFIGPEGGISQREHAQLVELGIESVTLGSRILRTETAALAAITIIMYETGEINL